jgi:2-dehydro-3-deoxyphosphogluconate aldolase/(4S)-4-hydroxy-2-oxoglutarate aldolase
MNFARFEAKPLMGIVRGVSSEQLPPLVDAVVGSGLETLEITMNTRGAPELIAAARELANGRLMLGAGTVLSIGDCERALEAGAGFIVTPVLVDEVAVICAEREVPFFPGALTPSEIHRAWHAGASMVKVFPARSFGPAYFREIKGPFDEVRLLACGGVSRENLGKYRESGADGFAFGGSVFDADRLAAADFEAIGKDLRAMVRAWELAASDPSE